MSTFEKDGLSTLHNNLVCGYTDTSTQIHFAFRMGGFMFRSIKKVFERRIVSIHV